MQSLDDSFDLGAVERVGEFPFLVLQSLSPGCSVTIREGGQQLCDSLELCLTALSVLFDCKVMLLTLEGLVGSGGLYRVKSGGKRIVLLTDRCQLVLSTSQCINIARDAACDLKAQ